MSWVDDLFTYVVSNDDTGYSDESMRFASRQEAEDWIEAESALDGVTFSIRREL